MKIIKPKRVSHTYSQTLNGTVQEIFPLYCPVREIEWSQGWDPKIVYSNSGVVEPDCIFITQHDKHESTWCVTEYDIDKGMVEMIYITPGTIPVQFENAREISLLDPINLNDGYEKKVKAFEKEMIEEALNQTDGNKSAAARLLNITERHLRSRLEILGMK